MLVKQEFGIFQMWFMGLFITLYPLKKSKGESRYTAYMSSFRFDEKYTFTWPEGLATPDKLVIEVAGVEAVGRAHGEKELGIVKVYMERGGP